VRRFRLFGWPFAIASLMFLYGDSGAVLGSVPGSVAVKLRDRDERPASVDEALLRFVKAREIVSTDGEFGGISALSVTNGQFEAISDNGTRYGFRLENVGVSGRIASAALPAVCGLRNTKKQQDSESLVNPGPGGFVYIGFEWNNRICRTNFAEGAGGRVFAPLAMRRWPHTGGAEAMAYLPDGRFLVFAERPEDDGRISPVLLFSGDPTEPDTVPIELRFNPPEGYRVSDATALPDGRLLVLVRRFSLPFQFEAKLLLVETPDYHSGSTLEGREVVTLSPPGIADNFEAVAIDRAGGGTRLWLASDDNFLWPQKNWVLEFELLPKKEN
jgi:hypothetical protein